MKMTFSSTSTVDNDLLPRQTVECGVHLGELSSEH